MLFYIHCFITSLSGLVKKTIFVIGTFSIIIALFIIFTRDGGQNKQTINKQSYKSELYTHLQTDSQNIEDELSKHSISGIMCFFVGEGCTKNPNENNQYKNQSLVGFTSNILTAPIQYPQASGLYAFRKTLADAHIIPQTYAAEGIGFAALRPFLEIWLLFRNFTYLIFVLIIIGIGFMIMFRAKINPQTVISVENAIPKIVISLLLITFSYSIVGFLIDLMYVAIGFVLLLISTYKGGALFPIDDLKDLFIFGKNKNIWDVMHPIKDGTLSEDMWDIAGNVTRLLPNSIRTALDIVAGNLIYRIAAFVPLIGGKQGISNTMKNIQFKWFQTLLSKAGLANKLQNLGKGDSGIPLVSIGIVLVGIVIELLISLLLTKGSGLRILLYMILFFSIVFIMLRLILMLFSAYISILISLILSPLILALEAIPGRKSFGSWFKNLILNLATFPIMIILILISAIIINLPQNDPNVNLWQPPLLFGFNTNTFYAIIGGIILFAIPDLIKSLREVTGIKPLPIALGPGSMFVGATSLFGGGMGLLGQFSSINLGLEGFKKLFGLTDEARKARKRAGSATGEFGQAQTAIEELQNLQG